MLKQCEFRVKCIVFIFVLIAVVYTGIGCRSSSSSEYQQRLQGMLLASAVADAMGGPHEGRSTEDSQAFLENGGWIQSFDAYTVWHHHHWNVYQRRAPAGTVTDDTRMRMDMTAFMIDYRKLYNSPLSEKDLASCVAERYSRARKAFERTDARYAAVSQPDSALDETRKQQFLAMWFAWEIFKTGTSVYIPEPAVTSPPYIRVSDDPDYGEYTPVWHLEPVQPVPVTESIKQTYHFNSYAKGHVMPLGLIHLLPAAAYFPGAPAEAYSYALSIDFFDVAEAPHYVGAACAILADLLGGRSWPEISAELMRSSLATYLRQEETAVLRRMDSGFKSAIRTAQAFKSNSQQDSVLPFIKALHRECAVDEPIMCTVQEMLFGSIAIVEYAHDDLPRLIEIGVNYGRDNDTIASIAAAFGGAAAGVDALSDEWQQTVKTANPQYNFAETASRLAQL